MAGIHDIVGALLRDITNARVTSDMYSRNISRYYEQDALLRRFPVPRMEVDTLEMDLKFAINDVQIDPLRTEAMEARLAIIFERHSDALTVDYIDAVVEVIRKKQPGPTTDMGPWYDLIKQVWSGAYHIDVRQRILRYLETTQRQLIDSQAEFGSSEVREAQKEVSKILARRWYYLLGDFRKQHDVEDNTVPEESELFAALKLDQRFTALQRDVKEATKAGGGYRVDVEVSAHRLQDIDASAICNVKVQTKVRNYTWTVVEGTDEAIPKYILNPE
jgi:hypothetical protein